MSLYPKLNDSLYLSSDDEVNNSEEFELDGGSDNLGRQELFNRETRVRHEQKKTPRVLNKSEFASGSSFPEIPRSERHSNATLSLEDFEQKYLGRRYNSQRRDNFSALTNRGHSGSRSHKQTATGHGMTRLKHTVERGVFWLEHTSKWRVVLVGCVLGLLCAVVYGELQLGTLPKGESKYAWRTLPSFRGSQEDKVQTFKFYPKMCVTVQNYKSLLHCKIAYVALFNFCSYPSLIPRSHPLTRRNGLVNQVKFHGLAHAFATV